MKRTEQNRTDLKALILLPGKARTIIHVLDEKGAGLVRVKMDSATALTKTARSGFKMERTMSFVLPMNAIRKKQSE